MMYSVYSLPNIFIPFFAGALTDKYGTRVMTVGCFTTLLAGNLIFAIGGAYNSFHTVIVGWFIFGVGCEIFCNCTAVMLTVWFIDKHLNLAYALNAIPPSFAMVLGGYYSPRLVGTDTDPTLGRALFMGFWITLLTLGFLIPMLYLDQKMEVEQEEIKEMKELRK